MDKILVAQANNYKVNAFGQGLNVHYLLIDGFVRFVGLNRQTGSA